MAVFTSDLYTYLTKTAFTGKAPLNAENDPVLSLAVTVALPDAAFSSFPFSGRFLEKAKTAYNTFGFLGVVGTYFGNELIISDFDKEAERKIYILKKGISSIPSTKMATIINGFGYAFSPEQIMSVYRSYGFTSKQKKMSNIDYQEINHRVSNLVAALDKIEDAENNPAIEERFLSWLHYYYSSKHNKQYYSKNKSRTLLYHYTDNIARLGMLGLFDKDKNVFRESKLSAYHEARIVINKLQHPEYEEPYFLDYLKSNDIHACKGTINNIFRRWSINTYKSEFVSDLIRLGEPETETVQDTVSVQTTTDYSREVNSNYAIFFKGLSQNPFQISSPGLLVIWHYLEELGIYPILEALNLTKSEQKYSWANLFLWTVGRIFCGIPTYSASCLVQEPSLAFFTGLLKPPCAASLLSGLDDISEETVLKIQEQLIIRLKEKKLINGKKTAFDFHQIDMDVDYELLRNFGKGPSPKKKICYSGFRPHIAWDIETRNLIVAEFRKSSARGTTTVKRFINELLLPFFKKDFEQIYLDSEYTGRDVWNYILDDDLGIGADITACLKQNAFIRKHRDEFLLSNNSNDNFWKYYDDAHVYSAETFCITWKYQTPYASKDFSLNVVVKKNINTGKYRCFGSSKINDAKQILLDYSNRWMIENGIKDLINSFFFNKIPGTKPNLVNVHFLIVSVCKHIYRMIQRDMPELVNNADGSMKTLQTLRSNLINQGGANLFLNKNTLEVSYQNPFSPKLTNALKKFYDKVTKNGNKEIKIMGGLKVKFLLKTPYGEEVKNNFKSVKFDPKNF